jgi:hypothetical protein
MEQERGTSRRGRASKVAEVILGFFLYLLVSGIWASLWVPPSPFS